MKLLSKPQASVKFVKTNNQKPDYLSTVLYLSPHKTSGVNLCPKASKGCIASCLFTAGLARSFPRINEYRNKKSLMFTHSRGEFITQLKKDLTSFSKKAIKLNKQPSVRLNGTSDIQWEKVAPSLFTEFPHIQFYDYTKISKRFANKLPPNYHLTFSRSENNWKECDQLLAAKHNVTVVFDVGRTKPLPTKYLGYKVIDGDKHDLRFLDKCGIIVGLRAKGKASKDKTGFVVRNWENLK